MDYILITSNRMYIRSILNQFNKLKMIVIFWVWGTDIADIQKWMYMLYSICQQHSTSKSKVNGPIQYLDLTVKLNYLENIL